MKKAKLIRKKVLWFHSRLEEELGIKLEAERVKPRLYQFVLRSNGICLGYTQLQIGLFLGEDIPFAESNGIFLSKEVDLVKHLIRYEYDLEYPFRDIVRVEKELRRWKREVEQKIQEIKKKAIVGGSSNVFGKRKPDTEKKQKMGKLNRRRSSSEANKGADPKRERRKDHGGSKLSGSSGAGSKQRISKGNTPSNRPIKMGKKDKKQNRGKGKSVGSNKLKKKGV